LPDCPLSPEVLPPNFRKHVEATSPKALRGMAAKGLVPMAPAQIATALYMLQFDAEPDIVEQARTTAGKLPDRILSTALRDSELHPQTLAFFAEVLADKEPYLEAICLNPTTPDEAIAQIALGSSEKLSEIISQNQLRLLRSEAILRALFNNGRALKSTLDGVADFAVRSGVYLQDVPALVDAHRRVYGGADEAPVETGPTADQIVAEFAVGEDAVAPLEDNRRLTFTQRISKMSIAEKIKLATKGNKEARTVLLRDSNKLVSMAAIQSPRITDGEILAMANNRTAPDDILKYISANRDWTKNYQLKLSLVKNPKVPLPTAMRFLPLLREPDIRELSRDRNVPGGVKNQARVMMVKKEKPHGGGGDH
jgi:hypothetical protein